MGIKRRKLEMLLTKLAQPLERRPDWEQYTTPAGVAADMLFRACVHRRLEDMRVLDLGCGNGVFSIGAEILGASGVVGVERDGNMARLAKENAHDFCSDPSTVSIVRALAEYLPLKKCFDTCLMNPPFGAQKKGADRPFIKAASSTSDCVYSLHNLNTLQFVLDEYHRHDMEPVLKEKYNIPIPHMFDFHRKDYVEIEVALIRAEKKEVDEI